MLWLLNLGAFISSCHAYLASWWWLRISMFYSSCFPCSRGVPCWDISHHHCSSDLISFKSLVCCRNELGDWPHRITPLINSIREGGRLASIKPDTFCPCTGINSQSSLKLHPLAESLCSGRERRKKKKKLLQSFKYWNFTEWQKILVCLQRAQVLFNGSKIEVRRGWVVAAHCWDCMSSRSGYVPTGLVVSCRLWGGKESGEKQLFLEAAQYTEGERKKLFLLLEGGWELRSWEHNPAGCIMG